MTESAVQPSVGSTTRPLRILQVASHAKVARGGAVQMIRLASELDRRGHEVHCIVHRPRGHERSIDYDFSELVEAGLKMTGYDQDRWGELRRFRRWLRGHPFDVIHAHRDRALGFSYLATWGMARPALIANRGTTNPIPRWTWARRAFRSPRLAGVVAVAEAVKEALISQDGVAREKIHVVYGSVETERFHPGVDGARVRREIGIENAAPLVGMPAALVHKKGHRDFLAMMPDVLGAIPEAHFLWVGEAKPEKIAELTSGIAQRDRLHCLGHRDDMPEVLAACSVVVCCSTKGEGLTGALREALAMARPVITTDVSGNREIVRDGETGRVVPISDPQAMARAVIATVRNPEESRRLAEAGMRWVLAECNDQVRADRVESIYRSVVDSEERR